MHGRVGIGRKRGGHNSILSLPILPTNCSWKIRFELGERFQRWLHCDSCLDIRRGRTQAGSRCRMPGISAPKLSALLSAGERRLHSMLVAALGFVMLTACFMGPAMHSGNGTFLNRSSLQRIRPRL
jgi:hypothetical protein